jgi:hypothetical protein
MPLIDQSVHSAMSDAEFTHSLGLITGTREWYVPPHLAGIPDGLMPSDKTWVVVNIYSQW